MSKSLVYLSQGVAYLAVLVVVVVVFCPWAAADPGDGATYLHLSDVHLDTSGASDDTDLVLWKATREKLTSILTGPDAPRFVLYTGDLPGHYGWAPDSPNGRLVPSQVPGHDANVRKVLDDLHGLVAETGIPLLYAPGNNDSLAGDYFSFTDENGEALFSLAPGDGFPAVNAAEPCGEPPCTVSVGDRTLGYFTARPVDGLRVIALNTIIWGRKYYPVDGLTQREAGDRQIDWLAEQLDDAAAAGDKVLFAMHIPPGVDAHGVATGKSDTSMWTRDPQGESEGEAESTDEGPWLDRFLDLVAEHTETVVALAYGHTHDDELRRLHDRSGKVIEIAVSAPGITTNHGNNPGFKLVAYDPETKELLGFKTFYTERGSSSWGDEYYTFAELYGCSSSGTILGCLTSPTYCETASVDRILRRYYTVMNGPPDFDPGPGIEVEHGQ